MSDTPKNTHEKWRDVRGYEERYRVSNYGRVINRWFLGTRPMPREFKAKGLHYYEAKI